MIHGPVSSSSHALLGDTKPSKNASKKNWTAPTGGSSFSATSIVALSILLSLLFIGSLSFSFIGGRDINSFKKTLDELAATEPGIVLIGENVDVDVDEPALTVTWSLVSCGSGYLNGSQGIHGSNACGIPNSPLDIYVDSNPEAAISFDPAQIPLLRSTGVRRTIQALTQFDSNHDLDVHEAHLYPFDTYTLSTTLRAVNPTTNETLRIRRLLTITAVSSFSIRTTDAETYWPQPDGTQCPAARGHPRAPPGRCARVVFAWRSAESGLTYAHGLVAFPILFIIPQMRNSMPDSPDLDGVLLDTIGFFPQMIICGVCAVVLLVLGAIGELDPVPPDAYETPMPPKVEAPPSPTETDGWTSSDTLISAPPTPITKTHNGWRKNLSRAGVSFGSRFAILDDLDQDFATPRTSLGSDDGQYSKISLSRPMSPA
ncbi:hypothetical protein EWM64_g3796 [Hericium alpestre]|uniref:Uncharacterized protein n=1 Tax=Hericium alpestre TaxID=135208 RepID=A0A4Z0A1K0_9AGAM|nr:hypothetical protein EWM64_g3796 [Hericium alpestre]